MKTLIFLLLFGSVPLAINLSAQSSQHDIGQYYPEFQAYASEQPLSLSYLSKNWPEREQWRIMA